ncbi:Killer toxin subunits alpha/beta [Paramyrothecium foliicola]|nr:Killer toxin subunits alpha/beta [Paramyrothecium foliicola]
MVATSRSWLLLGALFTIGVSATKRGDTPALVQARAGKTEVSNDPELDSWLGTLQRAPSPRLCPESCSESGWSVFPNPASLSACNETMLLKVAVRNDFENQDTNLAIRACTADYSSSEKPVFTPDEEKAAPCSTPNHVLLDVPLVLSTHPKARPGDVFSAGHLLSAGHQILSHLATKKPSCTENVLSFGYSQSSLVGVYAGAEVHQHGITTQVLSNFLKHAEQKSITKTTIVQLCETDGLGADYGVGIIAGSTGNFALVQEAMKTWADGRCVPETTGQEDWATVTLRVPKVESRSNSTSSEDIEVTARISRRSKLAVMEARADCRTTKVQAGDGCWALADRCKISQEDLTRFNPRKDFCTTLAIDEVICCSSGTLPETIPGGNADGTCKTREVVSGDGCGSLASKCGLTPADFTKVNSKTDLCSSLAVGQLVCCTRGTIPDLRPKPKPNGYCFDYTIKDGDDCSIIAARHTLTVANLESFNKNTWGWNGCQLLFTNTKMCLSTGTPPMPAQDPLAVCGPTVKGTVEPPAGTDISTLNPCPLNVCCNIWGNCGLTDDFCTIARAPSGAPGTSLPGKNSCIQNCGREIIKGSPPASKITVAYFEAWSDTRKCLKMDVNQIDTTRFSHIHFAFVDVTTDFKMDISNVKKQFDLFKKMTGVKKIASFGGWGFSTNPTTFRILRQAVLPANRATFVNNLVNFVKEHNLDGIDLDWEYPGAPDMPDIPPPSNPDEGLSYYQTLAELKQKLGTGKTVSFAAPASFHYLKSFPMKKMGEALDYIIYMTYDLHGQWDYGNKWTTPNCANGNCLRSHVNETETKDALAMITKAGVPSGKVVVGVSSYGRSFKMARAGCDGPDCTFTGSSFLSDAKKGRCTETAGYISNAEIDEIIRSGKVTRQYKAAGSNILVYDDTEWVAYMDEATKKERAAVYDSWNFAGTTDWAVDLQEFVDGSENNDYGGEPVIKSVLEKCSGTYTTFKQLEDRKDSLPKHCIDKYIYDVEIFVMGAALEKYKRLVDGNYDSKFNTYSKYVRAQVPDQIDEFMANKADEFFQCKETKMQRCCRDCMHAACGIGCNNSPTCERGMGTNEISCPTNLKDGHKPTPGETIPNATYTFKNEDGFYRAILGEYGIEKSWLKFGRKKLRTNNGCQYAGEDVIECMDRNDNWWYSYPVVDQVTVFNPKDLIGGGYDESVDLLRRMRIWQNNAGFDSELLWSDLADAGSLPALTIDQAVLSMDKIVEKADEIEKKEREEFILSFISGLLFFVPFLGAGAGAVGLGSLRSVLSLLGTAGEAGMLVYDIVQDPQSGFMGAFLALAGAGLGRSGFKNAANQRRGMSGPELNALGPIKDRLSNIETIRGGMCKLG